MSRAAAEAAEGTARPSRWRRLARYLRNLLALLLVFLAGPGFMAACGQVNLKGDWRTASRVSAGIAPDPRVAREAIVQVYAGRAFKWRGAFAVHTWIATKEANAPNYVVHEVLGWRARYGESSVVSRADLPDRHWYGARPELVAELRGPAAATAIPRIYRAVRDYPHAHEYVLWPGPNSNTFTAVVARAVPELSLDLPPTAIGKDYLPHAALVGETPSGTGFQVSLGGALGVMLAVEEGLEFNLLGLSLGLDPLDLAIKVPGVGRIGP